MSINQLATTIVMPLAGKMSDIFGRKVVIMVSLFLFTVGSLFSALAPNIYLLILSRLIQGLGSGGFLPSATGIIAEEFPKSRQQMIGFITSVVPIGQIIGPNIGGWMVETFQWRSVFWLNVPLGILALITAAFILRRGHLGKGQMDLTGAGLLTGIVLALMIGLSEVGDAQNKSSWLVSVLSFATALVFTVVFLRHATRTKDPIIEMRLLKERPFMAANIYNFILGAAGFGLVSFIPLYATSVYGMSTLASGVILTPRSIGMIAASVITSVFLMKWGYRKPIIVGTICIILSIVLLGIEPQAVHLLGIEIGSIVLLLAVMFLSGTGIGIAAPASNNACIELMPDRVATIIGVRGVFRQSGGAIGVAVTSIVLHNADTLAQGFTVVLFGLAAILLITIPVIFAMPKSPQAPSSIKK